MREIKFRVWDNQNNDWLINQRIEDHPVELLTEFAKKLERERNELKEALGYILGIGLTQKTKAKAEKALQIND